MEVKSGGQKFTTATLTCTTPGVAGINATATVNASGTYSVAIDASASVPDGNYSITVKCDQDPSAGPIYIYLTVHH